MAQTQMLCVDVWLVLPLFQPWSCSTYCMRKSCATVHVSQPLQTTLTASGGIVHNIYRSCCEIVYSTVLFARCETCKLPLQGTAAY